MKMDSEAREMTFVEAQRVSQERNIWRTIMKTSERAIGYYKSLTKNTYYTVRAKGALRKSIIYVI